MTHQVNLKKLFWILKKFCGPNCVSQSLIRTQYLYGKKKNNLKQKWSTQKLSKACVLHILSEFVYISHSWCNFSVSIKVWFFHTWWEKKKLEEDEPFCCLIRLKVFAGGFKGRAEGKMRVGSRGRQNGANSGFWELCLHRSIDRERERVRFQKMQFTCY